MAYYIYKGHAPQRLEYVNEFDAYREAKVFTRARRQKLTLDDAFTVRMIFAPNKEQAERLLTQAREARPMGEDA